MEEVAGDHSGGGAGRKGANRQVCMQVRQRRLLCFRTPCAYRLPPPAGVAQSRDLAMCAWMRASLRLGIIAWRPAMRARSPASHLARRAGGRDKKGGRRSGASCTSELGISTCAGPAASLEAVWCVLLMGPAAVAGRSSARFTEVRVLCTRRICCVLAPVDGARLFVCVCICVCFCVCVLSVCGCVGHLRAYTQRRTACPKSVSCAGFRGAPNRPFSESQALPAAVECGALRIGGPLIRA